MATDALWVLPRGTSKDHIRSLHLGVTRCLASAQTSHRLVWARASINTLLMGFQGRLLWLTIVLVRGPVPMVRPGSVILRSILFLIPIRQISDALVEETI
jgi:hypothetical protein